MGLGPSAFADHETGGVRDLTAVGWAGSVELSWLNPHASDPMSYTVDFWPVEFPEWRFIDASNVPTAPGAAVQHLVDHHELWDGTEYVFRVTINGESPVTVNGSTYPPPGMPALEEVRPTDRAVYVRWRRNDNHVYPPADYYVLSFSPGDFVQTFPGTATEAVVTGMTNGVDYTLRLEAVNRSGSSVAWYMPVTPHDNVVPGAVTGLSAQAGFGRAGLSWTNPVDDTLSHVVIRSQAAESPVTSLTEGEPVAAGLLQTTTLSGVAQGTTHTVTVFTVDTSQNVGPGTSVTLYGSVLKWGVETWGLPGSFSAKFFGELVRVAGSQGWDGYPPLADRRVELQERPVGTTTWTTVAAGTTDTAGGLQLTRSISRDAYYRWRFPGSGVDFGSTSETVFVDTPGTCQKPDRVRTSTPAVFSGGTWLLSNNLSWDPIWNLTFGVASDRPLLGDWNGDGVATPAVRRDKTWYFSNHLCGGKADFSRTFGATSDVPVVGDWDGDGRDEIGVVRGADWLIDYDLSGGRAERAFRYGIPGDKPIVGDWNGDGIDTVGIVRGNRWFLRNTNKGGRADYDFNYGKTTDQFVAGDWDGDGKHSPGVIRANRWLLSNKKTGGYAELDFYVLAQRGDRHLARGGYTLP